MSKGDYFCLILLVLTGIFLINENEFVKGMEAECLATKDPISVKKITRAAKKEKNLKPLKYTKNHFKGQHYKASEKESKKTAEGSRTGFKEKEGKDYKALRAIIENQIYVHFLVHIGVRNKSYYNDDTMNEFILSTLAEFEHIYRILGRKAIHNGNISYEDIRLLPFGYDIITSNAAWNFLIYEFSVHPNWSYREILMLKDTLLVKLANALKGRILFPSYIYVRLYRQGIDSNVSDNFLETTNGPLFFNCPNVIRLLRACTKHPLLQIFFWDIFNTLKLGFLELIATCEENTRVLVNRKDIKKLTNSMFKFYKIPKKDIKVLFQEIVQFLQNGFFQTDQFMPQSQRENSNAFESYISDIQDKIKAFLN